MTPKSIIKKLFTVCAEYEEADNLRVEFDHQGQVIKFFSKRLVSSNNMLYTFLKLTKFGSGKTPVWTLFGDKTQKIIGIIYLNFPQKYHCTLMRTSSKEKRGKPSPPPLPKPRAN